MSIFGRVWLTPIETRRLLSHLGAHMISIGCPNCGEDLKTPADSCPHCKNPLPEVIQKLLLEQSEVKTDDHKSNANYFLKHWRGELPLAISFWVNLILLNIAILLLDKLISLQTFIENPVTFSRLNIIYSAFRFTIIYPWQFVGLWRACAHYRKIHGKKTVSWSGLVEIVIILGLLAIVVNINRNWPVYEAKYKLGFQKDEYADYKIELKKESTLIHITGSLGFGVSEEVNELLKKQTKISGIILDSIGGRIYEGRELSKLILAKGLNTYSLKGCYSACVIAFISGKNRFLSTGANIAFHQYRSFDENIKIDVKSEQEKDLLIFKQQGIKDEFLDKIYNSSPEGLWYPAANEMLEAGIIHGVINPSELIPAEYEVIGNDLDNILGKSSAYKTLKKYHPQFYQELIAELREKLKSGTTNAELQTVARNKIVKLLTPSVSRSSDQAVIKFTANLIKSLKMLSKINPFLCVQYLYPGEYGALNMSKYFFEEVCNRTKQHLKILEETLL